MYWLSYFMIVVGLLVYQIAQKTVPKGSNPFWYVALAYLVGMVLCVALAKFLPKPEGAPVPLTDRRLLVSAAVLGVGATLIEVGYFFGYRSSWALGELPLYVMVTTSACLAVAGVAFFDEAVTPTRLAGMGLAAFGLFLMMKK